VIIGMPTSIQRCEGGIARDKKFRGESDEMGAADVEVKANSQQGSLSTSA